MAEIHTDNQSVHLYILYIHKIHVLFPKPLWPVHTHNDINDIVVGETPNTSAGQRLESIVKQVDWLTRQSSFLQNHFDPETNISQTCHKPYPCMQICKHDASVYVANITGRLCK